MNNTEAIAKALMRDGHVFLADSTAFTLGMFAEVEALIPFKCKLEQNYFREGDWVITCPEIMESHHNAFWAGQGSSKQNDNTEILNPTKWMDAWQHRVNPTWRRT